MKQKSKKDGSGFSVILTRISFIIIIAMVIVLPIYMVIQISHALVPVVLKLSEANRVMVPNYNPMLNLLVLPSTMLLLLILLYAVNSITRRDALGICLFFTTISSCLGCIIWLNNYATLGRIALYQLAVIGMCNMFIFKYGSSLRIIKVMFLVSLIIYLIPLGLMGAYIGGAIFTISIISILAGKKEETKTNGYTYVGMNRAAFLK